MIPTGTFIRTESGVFYVKSGKRHRVLTKAILESWSPPRVINIEESSVSNMPVVSKLRFRDGSFVYNVSDGTIYLIAGQERHKLVGGDTMSLLGLTLNDLTPVSQEELDTTPEGEEYR